MNNYRFTITNRRNMMPIGVNGKVVSSEYFEEGEVMNIWKITVVTKTHGNYFFFLTTQFRKVKKSSPRLFKKVPLIPPTIFVIISCL